MQGQPVGEERRWRGLAVSPGVARAEAHVIRHGMIVPVARLVPEGGLDAEWDLFQRAIQMTRGQVEHLKKRLDDAGEGREAGIFDAHLLILEDGVMLREVERTLREQRLAVDASFLKVMRRYEEALGAVDDEYLRERAHDMADVAQRVLRNLQAVQGASAPQETKPEIPHLLVARDLQPSETAQMDRNLVRGFVTEMGSQTSHTAIIARSLGIPRWLRSRGSARPWKAAPTSSSMATSGW
jgi:phosphoenolpyruvate-protein phosphotransferase (PTS system enzyme I)